MTRSVGCIGRRFVAVDGRLAFALIVVPDVADQVTIVCTVPVAIFELAMGFWLLLKRLRPSGNG